MPIADHIFTQEQIQRARDIQKEINSNHADWRTNTRIQLIENFNMYGALGQIAVIEFLRKHSIPYSNEAAPGDTIKTYDLNVAGFRCDVKTGTYAQVSDLYTYSFLLREGQKHQPEDILIHAQVKRDFSEAYIIGYIPFSEASRFPLIEAQTPYTYACYHIPYTALYPLLNIITKVYRQKDMSAFMRK